MSALSTETAKVSEKHRSIRALMESAPVVPQTGLVPDMLADGPPERILDEAVMVALIYVKPLPITVYPYGWALWGPVELEEGHDHRRHGALRSEPGPRTRLENAHSS